MITAKDAEFHTPIVDDSTWAEKSTRLRLVDRLDREWHLEGTAQTTFPWQAWPDVVGFNVLHEWRCDGRTGLGEAMDFLGMSQITALYNGLGS
jgi:hypothetical protein